MECNGRVLWLAFLRVGVGGETAAERREESGGTQGRRWREGRDTLLLFPHARKNIAEAGADGDRVWTEPGAHNNNRALSSVIDMEGRRVHLGEVGIL